MMYIIQEFLYLDGQMDGWTSGFKWMDGCLNPVQLPWHNNKIYYCLLPQQEPTTRQQPSLKPQAV